MSNVVLDATAVLALLQEEAGAEAVAEALKEAAVSAVNLAEVVGKLQEHGMTEVVIRQVLAGLGLEVVSFDEELAFRAGLLRCRTNRQGLSLGDRACLALGIQLGSPVMTADKAWAKLDVGTEIVLIR